MDARRISCEYADFIATCYKWHYFGTLTLHPEWSGTPSRIMTGQVHRFFWLLFHLSAVRAGGAFIDKSDADGVWRFRGPLANAYRKRRGRFVYVFGVEPQRRGALHAHYLLYVPKFFDRIDYHDVRRAWKYGRNDIQLPRDQNEVVSYVSKYVVKGGDLYLSESFESNRLASSQQAA